MAWARVDDSLYDHPKVSELLEEPEGWAALGFWIACLTWAHKHTRKPGKVPGLLKRSDVLRMDRAQAAKFAGLLVKVGMWELADDGWLIHDFNVYLPKAETSSVRSEAGRRGGLASGESRRAKLSASDAKLSASSTKQELDLLEANAGSGIGSSNTSPYESPPVTTPAIRDRADVERLCDHLADRVEGNGSKRPVPNKAWRDAARLMIDIDGRTEHQVHTAIDWCQDDEFWRGNIMSMPTLRRQYDKLRLAAKRGNGTPPATSDQRAMMAIQAGLEAQARDDARQRKELA